ncbi:hypothetical protein IFR05_003062 [Cadophora sp. M221]|nr:hypothetical protein IFR05_003062 [Cadophora sp. M221]
MARSHQTQLFVCLLATLFGGLLASIIYIDFLSQASIIQANMKRALDQQEKPDKYWIDGCWRDDICATQDPATRIDLDANGVLTKIILCWLSIGGVIIVDDMSSVEYSYLGLDHLEINQRSYNSTEEDAFCRALRRTEGKWWDSYWEWEWATQMLARHMSPTEKEFLHLGWSETGGVWLLRYENKYPHVVLRGTPTEIAYKEIINNATTMEERWRAIESCGGTFFKDPRDSEYIKPLLDGFGEHEEQDNSPSPEERNQEDPEWLLEYMANL